jgi:hypothetical protein
MIGTLLIVAFIVVVIVGLGMEGDSSSSTSFD